MAGTVQTLRRVILTMPAAQSGHVGSTGSGRLPCVVCHAGKDGERRTGLSMLAKAMEIPATMEAVCFGKRCGGNQSVSGANARAGFLDHADNRVPELYTPQYAKFRSVPRESNIHTACSRACRPDDGIGGNRRRHAVSCIANPNFDSLVAARCQYHLALLIKLATIRAMQVSLDQLGLIQGSTVWCVGSSSRCLSRIGLMWAFSSTRVLLKLARIYLVLPSCAPTA